MRICKITRRLARMDLTTIKRIRYSGLGPTDPLKAVYIGGAMEGEVPVLPAKGDETCLMDALVLVPHQWRAAENWGAMDLWNQLRRLEDSGGGNLRLAIIVPDCAQPWLAEIADVVRQAVCVEGRTDYYLDLLLYKL
jgi:hypothetical protein